MEFSPVQNKHSRSLSHLLNHDGESKEYQRVILLTFNVQKLSLSYHFERTKIPILFTNKNNRIFQGNLGKSTMHIILKNM